jgi:hypothetical protein
MFYLVKTSIANGCLQQHPARDGFLGEADPLIDGAGE